MDELPDDIDPALWFWSARCDGRDYLHDSSWLTHPGRMAVFCPHDEVHKGYRISKSELPTDLPDATRYFVAGFLAGNLPTEPDDSYEPASPTMAEWKRAAERFKAEGIWHVELDMEEPRRQEERQWVQDAISLSRLGAVLEEQPTTQRVTLPAELAGLALEAAQRHHYGIAIDRVLLASQFMTSLARIGEAIERFGVEGPAGVTVDLDARLLGDALHAADEGNWDL